MMKKRIRKSATIIGTLMILLHSVDYAHGQESGTSAEDEAIFPKGELGSEEFFRGNVWVTGLIENDDVYNMLGGNVEFEAGARSNWHSHPAGQILIVTSGIGYHQIEGEEKEIIKKGDVVQCPPNVNHWHGASEDSGMNHIYLIPNTEKGIVNWGDPVTDEEFLN